MLKKLVCSEVEFLSVNISFIYVHFANLLIFFHYLKQPDMFHEYDLNGYVDDSDDDTDDIKDDHNNNINDPVGLIIAAIQKMIHGNKCAEGTSSSTESRIKSLNKIQTLYD